MELLTLGSTFHPEKIVENFQSLIWSERYDKAGDFQLTTANISETLQLLPENSYVTLRDSTVPMRVETNKIENKKNVGPLLTVIGRSFEAPAFEDRVSVKELSPTAARTVWDMTADKESDAAYKMLRVVLGDVERLKDGVSVLPAIAPAVSPNDAIPEIDLILPADYSTGTTKIYEIKAGDMYSTMLELISINHRGIKAIRPVLPSEDKVGIEIYNGADLTNTVVFDARFDQIDDATYLLSTQGSKNVGYVYDTAGGMQVLKTAAPEPSGLARKVLLVDADNNATGITSQARTNRGLIELYKYNATSLFDGEVAEQVARGYNKDYFLGDILKLVGQYGLSQNVRCAEFIRSQDASGEKAYPTFEAVAS